MSASPNTNSLLALVASGDAAAMRECLQVHGPFVWSLARRWLRDDSLAEDAVQEIFIQVWKSAARYDKKIATEKTWIATIARRRLIDMRRKLGAAAPLEDFNEESAPSQGKVVDQAMLDDEVGAAQRAMSQLKPEQQRLLSLSILEGLSHGQIAAHTGLPLGTVKTHLRKGLDRLRGLLNAGGPTGEEVFT